MVSATQSQMQWQAFDLVVEILVEMHISPIGVILALPSNSSVLPMHKLGRQQMMAQVPESLSTTWKPRLSFQIITLAPGKILVVVGIWGVFQQRGVLSLCFSNKNKNPVPGIKLKS